jgi:hypothetical protein
LELKEGDQLKYVYDFGDWDEHVIEVVSTSAEEEEIEYPREIGRNEAKYKYCVDCQKKGKETVATWYCMECSDEEQEIFVCEDCLEENHEEHFADEILY